MDAFMHKKKSSVQRMEKRCHRCDRLNHVAKRYRRPNNWARTVTENEEVFTVHEVTTLDDSQVVSLKLDWITSAFRLILKLSAMWYL